MLDKIKERVTRMTSPESNPVVAEEVTAVDVSAPVVEDVVPEPVVDATVDLSLMEQLQQSMNMLVNAMSAHKQSNTVILEVENKLEAVENQLEVIRSEKSTALDNREITKTNVDDRVDGLIAVLQKIKE